MEAGAGLTQLQGAPALLLAVEQAQLAAKGGGYSSQHFYRFQRLQRADHANDRAEHARRAAVALRFGLLRVEAGITAMGIGRFDNQQLAAEPHRAAADQRHAGLDAGGIHRMTGGHVVAAIEHQIGTGDRIAQRCPLQALLQRDRLHQRVQRLQMLLCQLSLVGADITGAVQNLPLQIGEVELVIIGQQQGTNASGSQIQRCRGA